jgi:hypothetical protein
MSRYGISPILAVVIEPETSLTEGIIIADGGVSLDHLADNVADNPRVTLHHLSSIVGAVSYLSGFDVTHGDICDRNVCIKEMVAGVASPIMVVDFGETAPEYKGDKYATGELLCWCAQNLEGWTEVERQIITETGQLLKDGREFSRAVQNLEAMNTN